MNLNVFILKSLMAKKRITGAELSRRSGLTRATVSLIMARGTCNVVSAGKIADALGVPVEIIAAS